MKKLILLLILGLSFFTACGAPAEKEPTVLTPEAIQFFALAKENKLTEAYQFTGSEFKKTVKEDDFKNFFPLFAPADHKKIEWNSEEFDLQYGYLYGKITYKDNSTMPIKINFTKEADDKWHILYVGYHLQKIDSIPENAALKKIVHQTMTEFFNAVEKEDFKDFYNKQSSTLWQKQASPEAIKQNFTEFFNSKEAMKELKDIAPEISAKSLVEEDTGLEIKGQYKAEKFTLDFKLEYLKQEDLFKIYGIDINAK